MANESALVGARDARRKACVLKEACIDTFLGLPINWFLSYAVLATMLFFAFDNAFIISATQVAVLTVFAIVRKYLIRTHYKRLHESVQD